MDDNLGTVTIAPQVLLAIVRMATLSVPGVERMAPGPFATVAKGQGRPTRGEGVQAVILDGAVSVEVNVVVSRASNMRQVGIGIQNEVAQAIEHMLGMPVREVNVNIRDVSPHSPESAEGSWE